MNSWLHVVTRCWRFHLEPVKVPNKMALWILMSGDEAAQGGKVASKAFQHQCFNMFQPVFLVGVLRVSLLIL